jgi:hypothetical protein
MNKYILECGKNRLILLVRNHIKLNGNKPQAIPFLICPSPTLNKGKNKEN